MTAIVDFLRELGSQLDWLPLGVKRIPFVYIVIYLLSFLIIRFVVFIYCKLRRGGPSSTPKTAFSMLLATLLWPAFTSMMLVVFLGVREWADIGGAIARFLFGALVFMVFLSPVSTAMGLVLLVAYYVRARRLSARAIYAFVAVTMFFQFLYIAYFDI